MSAVDHILSVIEGIGTGESTVNDVYEALHVQERYDVQEVTALLGGAFGLLPPLAPPGDQEVSSLEPVGVEVGSAAVTLHVFGGGFSSSTVIMFDGATVATTYVSDTELTTEIDPTLADVGVVEVTVRESAAHTSPLGIDFTFLEPPPPEAA